MNRLHIRLIISFFLILVVVGITAYLLGYPAALRVVKKDIMGKAATLSTDVAENWRDRDALKELAENFSLENRFWVYINDDFGNSRVAAGLPHAFRKEDPLPGMMERPLRRRPPGPSGPISNLRDEPPFAPPDAPQFDLQSMPPESSPENRPIPPLGPMGVIVDIVEDGVLLGELIVGPIIPEDHIERGFAKILPLMGLFSIVLATLLLWPISQRLTRRLGELESVSARLSQGDLSVRAESGGQDEVGKLASRFNIMAETLEEQMNGRKRFFQAFSHEIRSPLGRIKLAFDLLGEMPLPDEERKCLDIAMRDTDEIDGLIDSLLEVAKESQGQQKLKVGPVDVIELSQALAEPLGARLRTSVKSEIINADPVILGRAIRNILENAVCYAGKEEPVDLSIIRNKEQVTLKFHDHGPGIPEDQLLRIFEPFYRPDESRNRDTGGIGLGLALVKQALQQHNGTVSASNSEDGGAVFTLTFPDNLPSS
jgi:signal transduction histidine kinase